MNDSPGYPLARVSVGCPFRNRAARRLTHNAFCAWPCADAEMPEQLGADTLGACKRLATCLMVSLVCSQTLAVFLAGPVLVAAAAACTGAAVVGLCMVYGVESSDEASIDTQLKRMKMEFIESCGKSNRLKQIYQELKQMDFQKTLVKALTFCMVLVFSSLFCLLTYQFACSPLPFSLTILPARWIVVYTWIAVFSLVAVFIPCRGIAVFIVRRQRELAQQELAEKKRLHALVFYQASQRGVPFRTVARPPEPAIARALRRCLPEEEKMCRLCWGDEAGGPLVKPCACRGSQMWVHEHCLEELRRTGVSKDAAYRCNLCMKEYRDALSLELLQKRTAPGQRNGW